MAMNIIVGDAAGVILGEINMFVEQIVWRSNDVGQAVGNLPLVDVDRYQSLLRFGNTILFQFDNGLPDWGGVIDTPRSWQPGTFQINAYSGEHLLRMRVTGKNEIYRQYTAGDLFRSTILEANARAFTGLEVAVPWYGGDTHDADYHYRPLLEVAQELVEDLSSADFYVTAAEAGGLIQFTARFESRRGSDLYGVSLVDGRNITNPTMDEQGPIVNHRYTVGAGTSWYTGRYVAENYDAVSENLYRRREGSEIQSRISSPSMLDSIGEQRLSETKAPSTSVTLAAINQPPALFADYDVGDSLPVDVPRYGFTGLTTRVRVLGREYMPGAEVCNLLIEET